MNSTANTAAYTVGVVEHSRGTNVPFVMIKGGGHWATSTDPRALALAGTTTDQLWLEVTDVAGVWQAPQRRVAVRFA